MRAFTGESLAHMTWLNRKKDMFAIVKLYQNSYWHLVQEHFRIRQGIFRMLLELFVMFIPLQL